ncbi:MAG TPA: phage tail assembly protein [Stellaceae bacterium]|jgi:hypothetical protein
MSEGEGTAVSEDEDKRALNGDGQPIDGTRKNDDGTVTIFLETPIKVMNRDVDEITLKRPRGKQMRGLDSDPGVMSATLKFVAALANIPPSSVDDLDAADCRAAGEVIKGFTRKTRVAGGN